MENYILGEIESKFADIIWQSAPLSTSELIQLCSEELGWKRTTTYTVLKKLCNRGFFENLDGLVIALMSKEEFYGKQSERYVERAFQGSLANFLTAYMSQKKLSREDIRLLEQLIEQNTI